MTSVNFILSILLVLVATSGAFQVARQSSVSTTSLSMGLFDSPKKKPEKPKSKSFLEGGGAKITVRLEEDNAMWVEEKKDDKKKKDPKKGK
jgi:hypothetical protein